MKNIKKAIIQNKSKEVFKLKKLLIVLLVVLLAFGVIGCKSQEQMMMEQAMEEFEEMTGQEQYADYDFEEDDYDMEPNDDGLDEEFQNERAGVDDGDGNGEETTVDTGDSEITVGGGEWPENAPDGVSPLGAGSITATTVTSQGALVAYTGVDREAADVYAANLESAGWQKISESIDSDWMAVFFQKDGIYLDIEWDLGDCYITWEG